MAINIDRDAPYSGVSSLLAMKGRMGDTELVHMTKPEVAEMRSAGELTINPSTGLPEHFLGGMFKGIKGMVKNIFKPKNLIPMAASMAGGAFLGPMIGGAGGMFGGGLSSLAGRAIGSGLGMAAGQKLMGRSWKDAGIAGLTTGGLTYGMGKLAGPSAKEKLQWEKDGYRPMSTNMGGDDGSMAGGFEDTSLVPSAEVDAMGSEYGGLRPDMHPVDRFELTGEYGGEDFLGIGDKIGLGRPVTGSELLMSATLANEGSDMAQMSEDTDKYNRMMEESEEEKLEKRKRDTAKYIPRDLTYTRDYGGGLSQSDALQRALGRGSAADRRFFSPTTYAATGGSLENGGSFEGMLQGEGHGMEDNIQMPINGGGIAAVSPKEYVVPADVMANLGNGNPDDGATAMDRFISRNRKHKYGRAKQPPQTDADRELRKLG